MDAEGAKIYLESKEKDMIEEKKTNLKIIKEQGLEFGVEGERAWLCRVVLLTVIEERKKGKRGDTMLKQYKGGQKLPNKKASKRVHIWSGDSD